jgi:hypothetical protein
MDENTDIALRGVRYAQDQFSEVVTQAEEFVREKPGQSLLIALLAGFILNRLPIGRLFGGWFACSCSRSSRRCCFTARPKSTRSSRKKNSSFSSSLRRRGKRSGLLLGAAQDFLRFPIRCAGDDRKAEQLIFQGKANFNRHLPMINFAVFNVTACFRNL